jgi:hypothetical protein
MHLMRYIAKLLAVFVALANMSVAHAIPILFETTSCVGLETQLDRPFSTTCTFSDLPSLVGDDVTLFIRAVGDINGVDEFLEIDVEGFLLTLLGSDATLVEAFGTNTVELIDQVISDVFLVAGIRDGQLVLTITGSPALANVTILELGLRYLSESVRVPEPGTEVLLLIGLIGIMLARRAKFIPVKT